MMTSTIRNTINVSDLNIGDVGYIFVKEGVSRDGQNFVAKVENIKRPDMMKKATGKGNLIVIETVIDGTKKFKSFYQGDVISFTKCENAMVS